MIGVVSVDRAYELLIGAQESLVILDIHSLISSITPDQNTKCIPGAVVCGMDELEYPFYEETEEPTQS